MINKTIYKIFKQGSRTFFTSSLFFPAAVRDDIFVFYSFVRVADDYVDATPAQLDTFFAFKDSYEKALKGTPAHNVIIDSFVELVHRRGLNPDWIEAFFVSMTLDTTKKTYETFKELDVYLYGSAEIVGLVMAKLLNLPLESYPSAQKLGRAFQYINFIRDIGEDEQLGRTYFPQELLKNNNLPTISKKVALADPSVFNSFMRKELDRYLAWQDEAEKGFAFIPKRYLIPIKTAATMYRYTARIIYNNPMIVYTKKVKPSSFRILRTVAYNVFFL